MKGTGNAAVGVRNGSGSDATKGIPSLRRSPAARKADPCHQLGPPRLTGCVLVL